MKIEVGKHDQLREIPVTDMVKITMPDGNEIRIRIDKDRISVNKMSFNEDGELHVTPYATNQIYIN